MCSPLASSACSGSCASCTACSDAHPASAPLARPALWCFVLPLFLALAASAVCPTPVSQAGGASLAFALGAWVARRIG